MPFSQRDYLWFKDAIIYQLHVKAFYDSNDDGIGDFKGLIEKLDYLKDLGITAVWLLPFYPSPLRDDGYDIADYYDIHAHYGTLRDFKEFLRQAHSHNLKVITELVINHTSDEHAWFKRAIRSPAGSNQRDYYVWNDNLEKYTDARIIFKDFETSNWSWCEEAQAYYWHRFYSHQPDLNFDNPNVQKEILKVADFWLGLGVDGLRLDAVPYLFEREGTNCENLPETHAFLKKFRAHVDSKFRDRMLLAEANQWPEDAVAYFGDGDESHMAFNFPIMPRMYMAVQMENRFPIIDIIEQTPLPPETAQWAIFLRNHDELTLEMVTDEERDYMYKSYAKDARSKLNLGIRRRLVPLLSNNRRKVELMNILLFSLPGTPIIYYGDEIGMGDNHFLGDRDGVRTPMQWSPDRNAGFSRANPQQLYLPVISDPEFHFQTVNVETQAKNLSSMLWWVRRVITMRKRFKAFSKGKTKFINSDNLKVLSFIRAVEDEVILVIINLSRFSQAIDLDLQEYAGFVPQEIFSQNIFPMIKDGPFIITLGPHNHFWLQLKKTEVPAGGYRINPLRLENSWEEILTGKNLRQMETEILPAFLKKCRWFGSKARAIRALHIMDIMEMGNEDEKIYLTLLDVQYSSGPPEHYFLPLACGYTAEDTVIQNTAPESIICFIEIAGKSGFIYDGVHCKNFHTNIFKMIAQRKKLKGNGVLWGEKSKRVSLVAKERETEMDTRVLKGEQSNTSIILDNVYFMKIFRKIEDGTNPDLELSRYLAEKKFMFTPAYAGSIQYSSSGANLAVGILQEYVPSQSDAWTYTTNHIKAYFDVVLEKAKSSYANMRPAGGIEGITNFGIENISGLIDQFFIEKMALLGKRTAQMHNRFASETEEADFIAEPFSLLYQRSLYQTIGSQARQIFSLLRQQLNKLPPEIVSEAIPVLEKEKQINDIFKEIIKTKLSAKKIRIHGDYHLGQILFTGKDFIIIDFEGEPARPLSERRLKRSALQDVAGMIRSFHYAAYATLLLNKNVKKEDMPTLEHAANIWYARISDVFLKAYFEVSLDYLPRSVYERELLLRIYLIDKAVYELGYELNNRPDWVVIPLKGILNAINKKNIQV